VQAAWNAGVVIVAGAGNDGVTAPFYPAALEHVVAVGAFDEFHKRASFSNYGNWVSIAAPGSNILSTYPLSKCQEAGVAGDMGCYAWLSGTSMATPHVSGAAALLWSRGDVTTNQQVVDLLLQNADPAGVSNVRLDSWTAHGGLNLHDAVAGGSATGKPVANAGPDQAVIDGDGNGVELVSLDGSASHDDNGALVAYDWREGTTVIGSGATVAATLAVGTHTLTLEVTDNDGLTATDTIVVTVQARSRVSVTASTPQAREAGLQPGVFTLTRDGDISGALAISYAVNGSATPGADYQPLSGAALFAAGVATVTVQVLPIDDDLSESNELVVLALSPGNGYVVGTPSSASVTVVSDDLPADLSISAATAPAMGGADRDLVVTDTTKNQGSGAAPDSSTGFYLSTNTSFDASDIFLGSRPVPRLDPAAVHSASTTLHIPAGTLSGSYYVIAKADSIDAVSESVETNNVRATAVVKIGPDLLVTVFTTPTTLVGGATFSVTDTTTNQGGGQADVSVTRYYLSTNSTLDANDVLLGSRPLAELSPGASDTGSAVLTLPPNMPGGSYYVVAQADGGTVVTEISESNNTKVGSAIKIGADLIASALNIPAMASIGGSFTITESTTNQGAGPVADSATGFFLSNDAGSDGGDVFLGARSVGVLATGAVSSGVTSVQIPAGTAPGTYYIVSKADWANLIFESVESNNTRVASIRIGPDLSQMSITGPSTAAAGSSFSASDVVSNQGSDGVGVSTTRYYLSTNSSLDAGDVLLASRVVPALAPGTSDNGAVVLAIPPQTVPGKYFIVVAADADGIVAEAVENNNSKGRNITITAH
jgi:subtilase family serine protease